MRAPARRLARRRARRRRNPGHDLRGRDHVLVIVDDGRPPPDVFERLRRGEHVDPPPPGATIHPDHTD